MKCISDACETIVASKKSISMNHVVDLLLVFALSLLRHMSVCMCYILHIVSINCITARVIEKIATESALSLSNELIV